jgi:hypothetical protein
MSISRLNILNAIITHRDISLFTLNASNAFVGGVKSISPLGAAALLNKHTVVQTLLELSPGLVSVDLPDAKGRTPLMCTRLPFLIAENDSLILLDRCLPKRQS